MKWKKKIRWSKKKLKVENRGDKKIIIEDKIRIKDKVKKN